VKEKEGERQRQIITSVKILLLAKLIMSNFPPLILSFLIFPYYLKFLPHDLSSKQHDNIQRQEMEKRIGKGGWQKSQRSELSAFSEREIFPRNFTKTSSYIYLSRKSSKDLLIL
jgi:hypothetical protein